MKTKFAFCLLSSACCLSAWADLSAVVQPGYVFGSNERPSTSTLNRLGNPTITITGTVGGTNASVAAGSINGTHLSDTIVDGTNITFNTASPRALKIVNAGVDVTQISTNIAGAGLAGGSGTNLHLNLDTNATPGLSVVNDMLTLSNVPPHRLNVSSNSIVLGTTNDVGRAISVSELAAMLSTNISFTAASWTSYEYGLTTGMIADTNHSLGSTPAFVRWVMVCTNADEGYAIGDEIDALNVRDGSGNNQFASGANSTNVWIHAGANVAAPTVRGKDGSSGAELNPSYWLLKCYARQ